MKILVTGATGPLGRAVAEGLVQKIDASQVSVLVPENTSSDGSPLN